MSKGAVPVNPERWRNFDGRPPKKAKSFRPHRHYPTMEHISDTDLERYYQGMAPDGPELAALEEYLLICGICGTGLRNAELRRCDPGWNHPVTLRFVVRAHCIIEGAVLWCPNWEGPAAPLGNY
jgi:hypothetical protein